MAKKPMKYNAKGAPAMKEASSKKDAFKKGGSVKAFKRGGKVGGRSPFSSAAGSKGRPGGMYSGKANDGHDS